MPQQGRSRHGIVLTLCFAYLPLPHATDNPDLVTCTPCSTAIRTADGTRDL